MIKPRKPPLAAGSGALPVVRDPRVWATAGVRLAAAIGVEAFAGIAIVGLFAHYGMRDDLLAAVGLAVLWSIYAMRRS